MSRSSLRAANSKLRKNGTTWRVNQAERVTNATTASSVSMPPTKGEAEAGQQKGEKGGQHTDDERRKEAAEEAHIPVTEELSGEQHAREKRS